MLACLPQSVTILLVPHEHLWPHGKVRGVRLVTSELRPAHLEEWSVSSVSVTFVTSVSLS